LLRPYDDRHYDGIPTMIAPTMVIPNADHLPNPQPGFVDDRLTIQISLIT
jgi:hypothetical protein